MLLFTPGPFLCLLLPLRARRLPSIIVMSLHVCMLRRWSVDEFHFACQCTSLFLFFKDHPRTRPPFLHVFGSFLLLCPSHRRLRASAVWQALGFELPGKEGGRLTDQNHPEVQLREALMCCTDCFSILLTFLNCLDSRHCPPTIYFSCFTGCFLVAKFQILRTC